MKAHKFTKNELLLSFFQLLAPLFRGDVFIKRAGLKEVTLICGAKFIGKFTVSMWNSQGCNVIL